MNHPRKIAEAILLKDTLEGAGVHLRRGFGYAELPRFDPFLLFDDFSSSKESDYLPGFPLHPHRGIETVTYILKGEVTHKDSIGNAGTIRAGDVQWMTAGSGIVHEEMPHGADGLMGFQLWINLPKTHKMMQPRYQEIKGADVPAFRGEGAIVHVIAGTYRDIIGPVKDIMANPAYLDITLEPQASITFSPPHGDAAFVYILNGTLLSGGHQYGEGTILRYENEGGSIMLTGENDWSRFLFIAGMPLNEPIAWHGPIVMNTEEEIRTALSDLRNGTFIK
jgi:quercetin 2,3-dioxygenase